MNRFVMLAVLLLAPVAAMAQVSGVPRATATVPGLLRATYGISATDFGACGDDTCDDTAALNAMANYARSATRTIGGYRSVHILIPPGVYKTTGPLNFTALDGQGSQITIDAMGAIIDAHHSGNGVIDAFGSRYVKWNGLTIHTATGFCPTTGMQIGLYTTSTADINTFEDTIVNGCFSVAAFYNRSSETSQFNHLKAWNTGTGYGLIQDGSNHFNPPSNFVTTTIAQDTINSFNEDTFISPDFRNSGGGGAVWLGYTSRHRFIGGYVGNTGTSSYAFTLYGAITDLTADVHVETNSVTDEFYLAGPGSSQSVMGLVTDDNNSNVGNSIFKLAPGVTSAALVGAQLNYPPMRFASKLFDAPSAWTVSGRAVVGTPSQWNLGATNFSGTLDLNGTVTQSGAGTFSSLGTGLAQATPGGQLSYSLPTSVNLSNVNAAGGLVSVAISGQSGWLLPTGGSLFPLVSFAAPPSGGAQATGVVPAVSLEDTPIAAGTNIVNAGSGYSVSDVLTLVGGTCPVALQLGIAAVNGSGGITNYGGRGAGYCTSLPAEPLTWSGGTGTGFQLAGLGWKPYFGVSGYGISAAGGGYTSPPAGTLSGTTNVTLRYGTVRALTTLLSNALQVTGGSGCALTFNNNVSTLGVAGAAGCPVIHAGASIDGSGVSTVLTSSGYTVPANTSLVRFKPTAAVTATITLPTALADGQPIQFVNYAYASTLTFSPAVTGWTNGSALTANTGMRIRWDATAGAWQREQ